jgi:hypothetical protein
MDPSMRGALQGMVRSISFESNATRAVTVMDPFGEKPPGVSDKAMAALRPTFIINKGDDDAIVVAPYGIADPATQAKVRTGGIIAGVAGLGLLALLIGRKR